MSLRVDAYQWARRLYWRLPSAVRARLNGPRHRVVRFLRQGGGPAGPGRDGDLSWTEFRSTVLDAGGIDRRVIVFEPTVHWDSPLFQRPQQMALALARLGWLVLYRTTGDRLAGFRQVADNVWLGNAREVDHLEGVVWSFYSTGSLGSPAVLQERRARRGRVVYEYVDAIDGAISGGNREAARLARLRDAALGGLADRIVVTAKRLGAEAMEATRVPVAYIPNGVDPAHYRRNVADTPLPPALEGFCSQYRTIVGYFGAIAPWLDYDTLALMTARRPDLGFLFIGADYDGSASRLPRSGNVRYVGPVEYRVLPAYARTFDVCLIPFTPGPLAESTSPLKLFEYFALERPVVVTARMPECLGFEGVIHGEGPMALSALDQAIALRNDSGLRQRLRAQADDNSWDRRAHAYGSFVGG